MQSAKISGQPLFKMTAVVLLAAALAVPRCQAERLSAQTQEAFDRYVQASELRMSEEIARKTAFLWIDSLPQPKRNQADAELMNGQMLLQQDLSGGQSATIPVSGGLIHDWTGIVFLPGVSISEVISVLQDYDQAARHYIPQVVKSKLLQHSGDDFRVFLRLKQVHVITVVLDTEYQVHYSFLDPAHVISRSCSIRIAEVQNASEPQEHEMPVGNDDGFLWRLCSYWRLYQTHQGVYIQCRAISLTRNVPIGLGWLVQPFLETIPRDSLRFTLESTRNALLHYDDERLSLDPSSTGEKTHER